MKTSDYDDISEHVAKIGLEIEKLKSEKLKIFSTSSLQSHSLPLLHIIHSIDPGIPVFFLNTGYHFPETIEFKEQLINNFGFNIQELRSPVERINQRDSNGRLMYASDPDYCCYMNKVLPLEPILKEYDIWVNGIRADQNSFRENLNVYENGKFNIKRYHPIIEWNSKMIHTYSKRYNLPAHPLEEKGYFSIGCMPCTKKQPVQGNTREARWFGMSKTECGLQTDTLEQE